MLQKILHISQIIHGLELVQVSEHSHHLGEAVYLKHVQELEH